MRNENHVHVILKDYGFTHNEYIEHIQGRIITHTLL